MKILEYSQPVGGWRPTLQQELLLRAALCQGEDALHSWQQWKESIDLDHIDGGSSRLLPLLYRNLKLHGVEEPAMKRLEEEYFRTWYNNELLFHETAALLHSFRAVGIETIALKGTALALHFYKDSGLRPMSDVDILVRPQKAELAIERLHEAGWKSIYESPEFLIPYQHSVGFSDSQGHKIDLHWRVIWGELQEANDSSFWEGAIPIEINNVPISILDPTDQLLHVCVHGAAWNDLPPLRWVADAAIIMRTADPKINWGRLVEQTYMRRLMLPMMDTLSYLQKFLDVPIPANVLETIRDIPTSRLERTLYRTRISPNRALRRLFTLYYWWNASRPSHNTPFHYKLLDFLRYLRSRLVLSK